MTEVITERIQTEETEEPAFEVAAATPDAGARQAPSRLSVTERYQPIRGAHVGETREITREGTRAHSRFGGVGLLNTISDHIKSTRRR